jgi:photosystem II stability/assembly factor-like uncharacterized protein
MKNWGLIFILILFASCGKESLDAVVKPVNSGTTSRINDLHFVSENIGYGVGGIQWESGVVLKTIDGGNNWSAIDTFGVQSLYGIHFMNETIGMAVGLGGKILRTENGGNYWSISQENSWEYFRDVFVIDEQNHIIASGDGYTSGFALRSLNTNWWSVIFDTIDISPRAVYMNTNTTGFMVGYGKVFKTEDAAVTWQTTDVRGDFFKSIHFPSESVGYIAGFQGSVLKTTDGGNSWEQLHKKSGAFFRGTKLEKVHFWDEYTGLVCGLNGKLLFTGDGGNNWKTIDLNTSENLRSVVLNSPNSAIVAGDNGKMWLVEWI